MESILRGLYNGKIIPWERHEKHSPEFLKVIGKIESDERYFTEKCPWTIVGGFRRFPICKPNYCP